MSGDICLELDATIWRKRSETDRIMRMCLLRWTKSIVLLGLILLVLTGAFAEATSKIVGKVTDYVTNEGLPGANVILVGTKMGAVTDLDGSYVIINIPVGTYAIKVSLLGYQTATVTGVQSIQSKPTRQDVELASPGVTRKDAVTLVDEEPPQIESSQLKATIITPHMEQEIIPGKNVLYCSTMQLAWNALEEEVIKEKIRLEGDPPVAKALNKRLSTKKDLSEDCYVAMAGRLTEDFLQRLNKILKEKFGDQAPPEVREPISTGPPQILAYAYLFRSLQFNKSFESLTDPIQFYSGVNPDRVSGFGIPAYSNEDKYRDMGKQVKILRYYDRDHFIIQLLSKSEKDEIVLAKIKPSKILLETIDDIVGVASVGYSVSPNLKENESLRIPILDFNVKHSFQELEGKRLTNKSWEEWRLGKAIQWIRFRLNEKGLILKSQSMQDIVATTEGPTPMRSFIFDKPYLIYLKQKGARYPYFAMWVGNTELMVKKWAYRSK